MLEMVDLARAEEYLSEQRRRYSERESRWKKRGIISAAGIGLGLLLSVGTSIAKKYGYEISPNWLFSVPYGIVGLSFAGLMLSSDRQSVNEHERKRVEHAMGLLDDSVFYDVPEGFEVVERRGERLG